MAKRTPSTTAPRATARPSGSLAQLQAQIAELQRQADELRRSERAEVIDNIKQAIAQYGLTAADLGLSGASKRGRKAATGSPIKYRDGPHTWTGRGRRPQWFVDALAAGKTAQDLLA